MAFTVKARRAESETEPGRFVGTGPRTVDSDSRRVADGRVAPDWGAVPAVDELADRSCLLVTGWRWVRVGLPAAGLLRLPAEELAVPATGLPAVAGLPVLRLLAARLLVVEVPAAGFAAAGLPEAGAAGAADAVDVAEAADPPEVRSWPDPVPAAGAVGCSGVAGGSASVEVDLSVCVGF
jgi:hypothetical protein